MENDPAFGYSRFTELGHKVPLRVFSGISESVRRLHLILTLVAHTLLLRFLPAVMPLVLAGIRTELARGVGITGVTPAGAVVSARIKLILARAGSGAMISAWGQVDPSRRGLGSRRGRQVRQSGRGQRRQCIGHPRRRERGPGWERRHTPAWRGNSAARRALAKFLRPGAGASRRLRAARAVALAPREPSGAD
jgi:hypothetical protein